MASPIPKPLSARQRRNRPAGARVIVAGPAARLELPADYHDMTRTWWATIWSSPIADEWADADTPGLVALAQLVEDFWRAPVEQRAKAHAEVRMASREYGLTPLSRRQLQWEVRRVEAVRPPPPAPRGRRATRSMLQILEDR